MRRKIQTVLLGLILLLTACHDDKEVPTPQPVPDMALRTVLVYIAGDNSLSSFAIDDYKEMLIGMKSVNTAENNLLVYIDRSGTLPQLIRLGKYTNGELYQDTIKSFPSQNSVGVTEMKAVMAQAYGDFPAESYGLVLWSHAEGWTPYPELSRTRWFGQDLGNGDKRMNINDLHTVLQSAPHFDFILSDACFMQSVEVVYELSDCADYFIASATEIPGPGANYHYVVPAMFAQKSGAELAKEVSKQYYEPYAAIYDGNKETSNNPWTGGVSIGVLKSSALENLAAATKKVFSNEVNKIPIEVSTLLYYGRGSLYYCFYDFNDYIKAIVVEEQQYNEWKQAFDAAMIQYATTPKNYSGLIGRSFSMEGTAGLSVYIPGLKPAVDQFYKESYQWYTAAGWSQMGM